MIVTETDDIRLYILVRSDIASLTPGKACAQVSHAANQCIWELKNKILGRIIQRKPPLTIDYEKKLSQMLSQWEGDRGFGTCIVLSATPEQIYKIVDQITFLGFHANITHDPTYPLRDGNFTHHIPLDTCAYVFGSKSELEPLLCHLSLM